MATIASVTPVTLPVPPTLYSPNSTRPVLIYRNALLDKTLQGALDAVQSSNGEWIKGGHWMIGREKLAATPHYHAVTHEFYAVLHGSGTYLLGKSPLDDAVDGNGKTVGVEFVAKAGDFFALPAGVTHFVTSTEDDYEIVGFYSLSERNSLDEPYDMEMAMDTIEETVEKRKRCELVPTPVNDPIYGKAGPMPRIWGKSQVGC